LMLAEWTGLEPATPGVTGGFTTRCLEKGRASLELYETT